MAIWENTNETVNWSPGHSDIIKCPRCGNNVYTDDILDKHICRHCGGVYDKDTMELCYEFERRDEEAPGYEESNKVEYVCRACGSSVVTDMRTTSEFCAFCGSKDITKIALTRQFRPDAYIPFKVTREEAVEKLKNFADGKAFVPRGYNTKATMSKVTGVYVPFWLVNSDTHLKVKALGTKKFGEGAGDRFDLDVKYNYQVKGIPFDGSKGVNDVLMEAIEPYDYRELQTFDDNALKGYFAERFDEGPLDMTERIMSRLYLYSGQCAQNVLKSYDKVEIKENTSTADNLSSRYVLLPMWFLNYEYEGMRYRFAVNGQTGECDGDMPVSTARSTLRKLPLRILFLLPAIAAVASLIIAVVFFRDAFVNGIESILKGGFFIVLMFIGIVFCGWGRNRHFYNSFEVEADIRAGIREKVTEGFFNLPDTADRMLSHADTELKRTMDEVPEVMTYFEEIPGEEVKIKESEPTAKTYSRSRANDR